MRLGVSLAEEDVAFIDAVVGARGLASRSAGLRSAVDALRREFLTDSYKAAFAEWEDSGEAEVWDATASDGPVNAAG
jgi:Arc/MetJ-type ribon-helix-helix transcriptional regulator